MPSPKPTIRVIVDTFAEHHISRLAREEGRSVSNMTARLLNEALHARMKVEHREQLVSAIRGQRESSP
jgi:hypothetical protein